MDTLRDLAGTLHAEPRMPDGSDRRRWPAEIHLGHTPTAEEVEQQLARGPDDANHGFPMPGFDDMARSGPLEFEPCAA